MRLTDLDTEDSPKLPQNFINNMKHTSDFDDMSVPYFDRLAVLVMEGIATSEEREEYAKLLKDNDKNLLSASLYSKCRLVPDASIEMPGAQKLKRRTKILPLIWKIPSAAALLALGWFGLARYSAMLDALTIDGIAESSVSASPHGIICVSANAQEITVPVSAVRNKSSNKPGIQLNTISDNVTEPDEAIPEPGIPEQIAITEPGIPEQIAMTEMPTRIPCALAESEKMTPIYYEPDNGPESGIWAYLKGKMNNAKESVAAKAQNTRSRTARIIDGIQLPVEIVRNENGKVESCSITALDRKITYRFL